MFTLKVWPKNSSLIIVSRWGSGYLHPNVFERPLPLDDLDHKGENNFEWLDRCDEASIPTTIADRSSELISLFNLSGVRIGYTADPSLAAGRRANPCSGYRANRSGDGIRVPTNRVYES